MDLVILNILAASQGLLSILGLASASVTVQIAVLSLIAILVTTACLLVAYAIISAVSNVFFKKAKTSKSRSRSFNSEDNNPIVAHEPDELFAQALEINIAPIFCSDFEKLSEKL